MSFINTKEPLQVGKQYQYKEGITGFGDDEIIDVILVKNTSTLNHWRLTFELVYPDQKPEWLKTRKNRFTVNMLKGNFYYSGMPRIWDEGEYV